MPKPTTHEALGLIREHYGLTMAEAQNLMKAPLHPRTVRDEFAGQALTAALMNRQLAELSYGERAEFCYRQADAMLGARIPKEPDDA
jgi:hypothetical protein